MKTFFQIFLLMCGVFGVDADEVKSVSVMEGDSVTLNPDLTEIQKIIQMQWRFGDPVIAKIDGNKILYPNYTDIFRGRLQLTQTGSLTIKNMRTKHTGIYKLSIDLSTGRLQKTFSVTVYETPSVIDAGEAEVKIMSMEEGKSVILQTDVTELSGDELIVWRFGDEGKLIAKADIEIKNSTLYGTTDERFKDRLQLNHQTGSLTITNTRTTDSGLYKLQISSSSSKQTLYKKFTLIVTVRVFTEPGLSSGAKAGIVFAVLLVAAAATAAVVAMIYYCRKIAEMQKLSKQLAELSKQLKKLLEFFKDLPKTSKQFKNLLESIEQLLAEHKELSEERKKELLVECDRLKKFLNSCEELKKTLEAEKEPSESSKKLRELFENNFSKQIQKICGKLQWKVKNMPVNVEDNVYLNPEAEIQENDQIEWLFGDEKTLIATAKGGHGKIEISDSTDNRFIKYYPLDRFKANLILEKHNESLVILAIRAEQAGLYQLKITRGNKTRSEFFNVVIREVKNVSVEERGKVTLNPEVEIQENDHIEWLFGDEKTLIGDIKGGRGRAYIFERCLTLDGKTGSLKISPIRAEQAGLYELKITRGKETRSEFFKVVVRDDEDLYVNVNEEETGKRVNESNELKPLLNREGVYVVNEQEGTSSL